MSTEKNVFYKSMLYDFFFLKDTCLSAQNMLNSLWGHL